MIGSLGIIRIDRPYSKSFDMSESSLSDAIPSETVLERALRDVVQAVYSSGNMAELTVKRVRKAAEDALKLDDGFFKEEHWKDRSKHIIEDEVVRAEQYT